MQKKGEMLEVGLIKAAPMTRFGRNQRRAAAVAPGAGSQFGLIRFKTWDEVALWKKNRHREN
jgi:hypothetical protein